MAAKAALEEKALSAVPAYMVEQNRPYSAIDVYTNMRQEFGKALVVKALEHGVSLGLLKEKVISKQKIFYVNQDRLPASDESALANLDREVAVKAETYATLSAKYKTFQNELAALRSEETTSALRAKLDASKREIAEMRERVGVLKAAREGRSGDDAEIEARALLAKEESIVSLARKRKRIACDILNTIRDSDACPPKKDLLELIGVEVEEGEY